jgi:hypothetical protein
VCSKSAGHGRRTLVHVSLSRDITEHKQTEEALKRRSAQPKSMVEVARPLRHPWTCRRARPHRRSCREVPGIPRAGIAVIEPETNDAVIRFVTYRGMKANFNELRSLHWRDRTTPTAIQERRPVRKVP